MSEDTETDDIKLLMYQAFEQAFQAQLASLYKVYISNASTVEQQKTYTKKGIENAVAAYKLAVAAVDAWEDT